MPMTRLFHSMRNVVWSILTRRVGNLVARRYFMIEQPSRPDVQRPPDVVDQPPPDIKPVPPPDIPPPAGQPDIQPPSRPDRNPRVRLTIASNHLPVLIGALRTSPGQCLSAHIMQAY
jgi:hypothetical protein